MRKQQSPYLQVCSDEDGNAYLIVIPMLGWRMDFELDDETLQRLRDEIDN